MSRKTRKFRRLMENRELLQRNFFRALDRFDKKRMADRHMPWRQEHTPAPIHNGRKARK